MKRLALLLIVSLVLLILATPASGKAVPRTENQVAAGGQAITLTPAQGKPGELITVNGTGFNCHSGTAVALVTFDGTGVNGTGSAVQCDSTFSTSFRVPVSALPGSHTITAEGMAPQSAPAATAAPAAAPTATATPVPTATSTTAPLPSATAVPPTETPPTAAATPTSTPLPPTSTPLPPTSTPLPPTSTPVPPISTNTPAIETIPSPGPTLTPVVLPTPPPTSTPTPLPTATPRPTPTPCTVAPCYLLQPSSSTSSQPSSQLAGISYQLAVNRQAAAAPPGQLTADGDKASATFQVTAVSTTTAPFTVTQSAACSTTPVVGVTTPCTITETVTNNTNDTLDFSHTVTNHLASNVRFVSATATTGAVTGSGSNVVWNDFELAPHQSAQATVQVSFTPSAAQVGGLIVLSDGITADAADVTTGKSYALSYGTVAINLTVAASSAGPTSHTPHAGGGVAAPAHTSSSTSSLSPSVSSRPSTQNQQGTSGLPTTGGGGTQVNLEYLAP